MTPPAATAAGRLASGGAGSNAARSRAHVRPANRPEAPQRSRQSRRVSGPAGGLRALRQRSPEVRRPITSVPVSQPIPEIAATPAAADAQLRQNPGATDSAFRLLSRGRALILLFAGLLAGLVFAQEKLTGMNASLGSKVQQISELQRDNAVLRSSISALSSDQRVVAQARRMGYVEPPVGSAKFISVSTASPKRAAEMMVAAANPSAAEGQALTSGTSQISVDGLSGGAAVNGGVASQLTSGVAATVGADSAPSDSTAVTTAAVSDGGTDQGNG